MADLVIDMNDARPIWTRPESFVAEISAALPADWSMVVLDVPSEGTGDGATRADPQVLEAVRDATVYMGFGIAAEVLDGAPHLRWVHSGSAGVASSITPSMLEHRPIFTNSAGLHGIPMAESVLGMLLHFTRGFDYAVRAQSSSQWNTGPFYAANAPLRELSDLTVGIVGYGGIGREIGRRLEALGSRVIGIGRSTDKSRGDLHALLRDSDAVVLTAPDTPETRGMINAEALASMKPGAVLINVSRGALVDEPALVEALERGHLRGAGLDVFATEPLPAESALWTLPNVLVTPHVSPVSRGYWRRQTELTVHNLRAFAEGRIDEMRNVVDLEAGY
jgi:phosphoglycerate dehydrogenase-like enzyme